MGLTQKGWIISSDCSGYEISMNGGFTNNMTWFRVFRYHFGTRIVCNGDALDLPKWITMA